MAVKVLWLRLALQDLVGMAEYIGQDDPGAARLLIRKIETSVKNLQNHPTLGRQSAIPGIRELVIVGTPYIVPYRIQGEQIELLRLFHSAQDSSTWRPES